MTNQRICEIEDELSTERGEYLSLGGHWSTLDGVFSAEELRKIAAAMDIIKADPCPDNEFRNDTDPR